MQCTFKVFVVFLLIKLSHQNSTLSTPLSEVDKTKTEVANSTYSETVLLLNITGISNTSTQLNTIKTAERIDDISQSLLSLVSTKKKVNIEMTQGPFTMLVDLSNTTDYARSIMSAGIEDSTKLDSSKPETAKTMISISMTTTAVSKIQTNNASEFLLSPNTSTNFSNEKSVTSPTAQNVTDDNKQNTVQLTAVKILTPVSTAITIENVIKSSTEANHKENNYLATDLKTEIDEVKATTQSFGKLTQEFSSRPKFDTISNTSTILKTGAEIEVSFSRFRTESSDIETRSMVERLPTKKFMSNLSTPTWTAARRLFSPTTLDMLEIITQEITSTPQTTLVSKNRYVLMLTRCLCLNT